MFTICQGLVNAALCSACLAYPCAHDRASGGMRLHHQALAAHAHPALVCILKCCSENPHVTEHMLV